MTVSEQIISVIDALCEKFGIAINWTEENVIPYVEVLCRKLVTYEIVTSIVWLLLTITMIIISIRLTKRFYPAFKRGIAEQSWDECGWTVGAVFSIIGLVIIGIVCSVTIAIEIEDIIKCLTFPEMYVFEYVSDLVQGA